MVEANSLLHGQETDVFADAGYQGAHKRPDAKDDVQWHVAMRPGLRKLLDKADPMDALTDQVERIKGQHPRQVEPVPRHQAPVRPCEGALPRPGQEHSAVAHAVRAGQSVDGAQTFDRELGMSAPGAWEMGAKRAQNARHKSIQPPLRSCQHTQPWSVLICAIRLQLPSRTYSRTPPSEFVLNDLEPERPPVNGFYLRICWLGDRTRHKTSGGSSASGQSRVESRLVIAQLAGEES